MMFLLLLLIFAGVSAAIWVQGFWSAAVTFVNLLLAMMIATNLYEPVATMVETYGAASWTYLLDFVVLWLLFFVSFALLRVISDLLSQTQVKFVLPLEMGGRSLLAVMCGWLFTCFVAFSLHMAPLNSEAPLGAWSSPSSNAFLFAPDRLWMRYMFDRSRGAFARGHFSDQQPPPADQALNVETFDPRAEFALKYHERRKEYAANPEMRVLPKDAAAATAAPQ